MEKYGLWVEMQRMKDELSIATTMPGGQYVITTGIQQMQMFSADSLDTNLMVKAVITIYTVNLYPLPCMLSVLCSYHLSFTHPFLSTLISQDQCHIIELILVWALAQFFLVLLTVLEWNLLCLSAD